MIVVGVDPGARETGVALVDTRTREILASTTVRRPAAAQAPILEVEPDYLVDVVAVVHAYAFGTRDPRASAAPYFRDAELVAVEGVRRPSWRVAGKVKPTDPSAIIATAFVAGAVLARSWGVPLVVVPPGRNGSQEYGTYPAELVTASERRGSGWELRLAGDGQLRHERSAYDVALAGPFRLGVAQRSGSVYR